MSEQHAQSLSLQDIYNTAMLGKEVILDIADANQYNSLRTALLRKFRRARADFEKCGLDWRYEKEYLSCRMVKATETANCRILIQLLPLQDRKTRSVTYRVSEI